jgi:hypothetical protein
MCVRGHVCVLGAMYMCVRGHVCVLGVMYMCVRGHVCVLGVSILSLFLRFICYMLVLLRQCVFFQFIIFPIHLSGISSLYSVARCKIYGHMQSDEL